MARELEEYRGRVVDHILDIIDAHGLDSDSEEVLAAVSEIFGPKILEEEW